MNVPDRRSQLLQFIKTAHRITANDAKELMAQRGYRDEKTGEWVGGLLEFVRRYWHILEPATEFKDGWALEAVCEHLEAVTFGEVDRLLINIPPGFMKSLLTDVFWPAWEWGPMDMAHIRYVAFSYSAGITERDNDKFAILITSKEYQQDWGDRVKVRKTGRIEVANKKHGRKLATSIGGLGTGERGDRIILDDPHNVKESESETVRTETVRWFREAMSNRLNDPKTGAIVIIMQRVHEGDVSGTILDVGMEYVHLCIPMEFDWERSTDEEGRPIQNDFGWVDPRWMPTRARSHGLLAWPERFGKDEVRRLKRDVDSYAWAGQYQQIPMARGGGIIKTEYWQPWEPVDGKFPTFEYIVASLDSAFSKKKVNDPSALTVWGVFINDHGHRRIMLVHAWRARLPLHGALPEKKPNESTLAYRLRAMPHWGIVERVADTCRRFHVDRLLIENKANGGDVGDEMTRLYAREGWSVQMINPTLDKIARTWAVSPTWTQGMIYAPDRQWATDVIDEMAAFPRGKHDDYNDSSTQAIKHLREIGLAQSDEETTADERENVTHKPQHKSLAKHYQGM